MSWKEVFLFIFQSGFVLLLFAGASAGIVALIDKNKNNKHWIIAVLSLLLTCLTIAQLQSHSVLFKTEATVLQKLDGIQRNFIRSFGTKSNDTNFVKNNFIFINTSLDPFLLPNTKALRGDSTQVIITHRRKLAKFLDFINHNSNTFDLVVCDIVFDNSTAFDKKLRQSLDSIDKKNKLVLAYNSNFVNKETTLYKDIGNSSFGEVMKADKDQPFYFINRLVNEEQVPSLPYQMYLHLTGNTCTERNFHAWPSMVVEKDSAGRKKYAFNEFITELRFIDEDLLYASSTDETVTALPKDSIMHVSAPDYVYNLGYACTEEGQVQLKDYITTKKNGYHNIVVMGNVKDAYSDRHQTAYGPLYGITIRVNEFFQIAKQRHLFELWQLLAYVVMLLGCYVGVLYFLFWRAYKKEPVADDKKKYIWKKLTAAGIFLTTFFYFILEEIHYVFLIGVAVVIQVFFHKTINVLGLIYYFVLFSTCLKFFICRWQDKAALKLTASWVS